MSLGGHIGNMPLQTAVSSLKRDTADEIRGQCREHFVRGVEVEDLAGAVVQ
jgi:hypothetical protein